MESLSAREVSFGWLTKTLSSSPAMEVAPVAHEGVAASRLAGAEASPTRSPSDTASRVAANLGRSRSALGQQIEAQVARANMPLREMSVAQVLRPSPHAPAA